MIVIYMEFYKFSLQDLINEKVLTFTQKVEIFKQVRYTLLIL